MGIRWIVGHDLWRQTVKIERVSLMPHRGAKSKKKWGVGSIIIRVLSNALDSVLPTPGMSVPTI